LSYSGDLKPGDLRPVTLALTALAPVVAPVAAAPRTSDNRPPRDRIAGSAGSPLWRRPAGCRCGKRRGLGADSSALWASGDDAMEAHRRFLIDQAAHPSAGKPASTTTHANGHGGNETTACADPQTRLPATSFTESTQIVPVVVAMSKFSLAAPRDRGPGPDRAAARPSHRRRSSASRRASPASSPARGWACRRPSIRRQMTGDYP